MSKLVTHALVAFNLCCSVSYLSAATYYVSPAGSAGNNGTSSATPKATIAQAVGLAAVTAGDVISLAAGTYTNAASGNVVNKAGLRIVGPQQDVDARTRLTDVGEAILQPPSGTALAINGQGTSCVINGLTIKGRSGAPAVNVSGNLGLVTLLNNRVIGGSATANNTNGFHCNNTRSAVLSRNTFSTARVGINGGVDNNTPSLADDVATSMTVTENEVSNCLFGIACYASNSVFQGNTIRDFVTNTIGAVGYGFGGSYQNTTITENLIYNLRYTNIPGLGSMTAMQFSEANGDTPPTNNMVFTNNIVSTCTVGISFGSGSTALNANYNIIINSAQAAVLRLLGTNVIPARGCYWGPGGPNTASAFILPPGAANTAPYAGNPATTQNDALILTGTATQTLIAADGATTSSLEFTPLSTPVGRGGTPPIVAYVLDETGVVRSTPDGAGFTGGRVVPDVKLHLLTTLADGTFRAKLRLGYTEASVAAAGIDPSEQGLFTGTFDFPRRQWVPAPSLNTTGSTAWQGTGPETNTLGDYGVRPDENYTWAVIDHATQFATGDGLALVPVAVSGFSAE